MELIKQTNTDEPTFEFALLGAHRILQRYFAHFLGCFKSHSQNPDLFRAFILF